MAPARASGGGRCARAPCLVWAPRACTHAPAPSLAGTQGCTGSLPVSLVAQGLVAASLARSAAARRGRPPGPSATWGFLGGSERRRSGPPPALVTPVVLPVHQHHHHPVWRTSRTSVPWPPHSGTRLGGCAAGTSAASTPWTSGRTRTTWCSSSASACGSWPSASSQVDCLWCPSWCVRGRLVSSGS